MIDTVVFDFVNTLAYLNPKRENVIYSFLTEKGLNISKNKIVDGLKIADDECHYSCFEIVDKESKIACCASFVGTSPSISILPKPSTKIVPIIIAPQVLLFLVYL